MAKLTTDGMIKTGNVELPRDNYVYKCTKETPEKSKSSGNRMITYDLELVGIVTADGGVCEVINTPEGKFNIAGKDAKFYLTLTQANMPRVEAHFTGLTGSFNGIDPEQPFEENPEYSVVGKFLYVLGGCESNEARREPTPEQKAKGMKQGDIIKHPVTGQPIVYHRARVEQILAIAELDPGSIVKDIPVAE